MPLDRDAVVKDLHEAIENLRDTLFLTSNADTINRLDGMIRAYEAVLDSIEMGVWDE